MHDSLAKALRPCCKFPRAAPGPSPTAVAISAKAGFGRPTCHHESERPTYTIPRFFLAEKFVQLCAFRSTNSKIIERSPFVFFSVSQTESRATEPYDSGYRQCRWGRAPAPCVLVIVLVAPSWSPRSLRARWTRNDVLDCRRASRSRHAGLAYRLSNALAGAAHSPGGALLMMYIE